MGLFILIFLVSLVCLIIGLIKPKFFEKVLKKKANRKMIGLVFGLATFASFILIGITAPKVEPKPVVKQEQKTEQKTETKAAEQSNDSKLLSVTKIVDGDTIDVDTIGRVRLIGIDTPETVDPRKPVQCFGQEASNKAKELLANKKVKLESDSISGDKDSYGRSLRYVFLEDGTNFNKLMIGEGYAHEYTYNSIPYKYQSDFKEAEKQAREANKGLWASNTCNGDTEKPVVSTTQNNQPQQTNNTTTTNTQPATTTTEKPATTTPQTIIPPTTTQNTSGGVVKKSSTGICHAPGTTYYDKTTNYTPYSSIDACLASGGRLPKR